jgi:hypothetical protein
LAADLGQLSLSKAVPLDQGAHHLDVRGHGQSVVVASLASIIQPKGLDLAVARLFAYFVNEGVGERQGAVESGAPYNRLELQRYDSE